MYFVNIGSLKYNRCYVKIIRGKAIIWLNGIWFGILEFRARV